MRFFFELQPNGLGVKTKLEHKHRIITTFGNIPSPNLVVLGPKPNQIISTVLSQHKTEKQKAASKVLTYVWFAGMWAANIYSCNWLEKTYSHEQKSLAYSTVLFVTLQHTSEMLSLYGVSAVSLTRRRVVMLDMCWCYDVIELKRRTEGRQEDKWRLRPNRLYLLSGLHSPWRMMLTVSSLTERTQHFSFKPNWSHTLAYNLFFMYVFPP